MYMSRVLALPFPTSEQEIHLLKLQSQHMLMGKPKIPIPSILAKRLQQGDYTRLFLLEKNANPNSFRNKVLLD